MTHVLELVVTWALIVFLVAAFLALAIGAFIAEANRIPTPKPFDEGGHRADRPTL